MAAYPGSSSSQCGQSGTDGDSVTSAGTKALDSKFFRLTTWAIMVLRTGVRGEASGRVNFGTS